MKKTDIAMILLIAISSVLIAFFVTRSLIGSSTEKPVKVDTIDAISSDFQTPDPTIFNSGAINPAVEVQITPSNQ